MITDPIHLLAAAALFGAALIVGYLHGRRDGFDRGWQTGYEFGQARAESRAAAELRDELASSGTDPATAVRTPRHPSVSYTREVIL